MKYCLECGTVNGHHPNCPEADDWDESVKKTDKASIREAKRAEREEDINQFTLEYIENINRRLRDLINRKWQDSERG